MHDLVLCWGMVSKKTKGKDTENDGKEDKKCCDHDHGTAAGATEEDEGSTKGKTLPAGDEKAHGRVWLCRMVGR